MAREFTGPYRRRDFLRMTTTLGALGITTVTIDVTAAPVGVGLGTLPAFSRVTINATGLAGWPAGRTPKAILQQGAHASGYIRRAWKPTLNSGTHIDLVTGWQKTTSAETIRLQLDNNSEIDLTYTVGHNIPAPTGGGVTRTLDRTGGGNFTTWAAAIGALTSGDVLVVRARTGTWTDSGGHAIPNYVYDVTSNVAPPSGVTNVTVVAHPDDVAAGRRPILWRNAGQFARFKYAAADAWQVHATLSGSHGTIYQSVARFAQPNHSYFGAYKNRVGDWTALYPYQAISDATDRAPTLHDTTYGPTSIDNSGASFPLTPPTYFGPGVLYNKATDRWEVRLTNVQQKSYQNPNAGLPWPPWNWTGHYAPNNDARLCEIVITDGAGFSNGNCLLDINGRNGWKFYNIDFIYGNFGVKAGNCATQPQFFGCFFLGGAPTDFNNDTTANGNILHTSSAVLTNGTTTAPSTDLLFDRCSIHGAMPPWTEFGEGKGARGAFGVGVRRDFLSWSHGRALFRYCDIKNWWQFWWLGNGNAPHKAHFHHSRLLQFGMDGALLGENSNDTNCFIVNRCFMPSAQMYGFTTADDGSKQRHMSFCVDLRLSTLGCGVPNRWKWGYNNATDNVVAYVHSQSTAHASGARSNHQERKFYNTCVGSQNTNPIELSDSSEGCGSGMGPDSRGTNHRIFNNIGAVYPSPVAWPPGRSNFVVFYTSEGGNSQYNHNILFKSSGMLAPGAGSNTFAKVNAGSGAGTSYADIAALRSGTGFEANGAQTNPQFVVTPAWASSDPYNGAWRLSNYLLGASSPARTGARNLNDQSFPDYDFQTLTTWAGGTNAPWRGALQPDVPAHEQEVGIVGPLPPLIV
jgi:hypothetical protein